MLKVLKKPLLALSLLITLGLQPAQAQQWTHLLDPAGNPISSTNPLPTSTGSGSSNVVVTSTVAPTGLAVASSTTLNGTVGTSAAPITFTAPSNNWDILNTSAANILYFSWVTTASAGATSIALPAGAGYHYGGTNVLVSSVSVIGSGAGTTYSAGAK